MLTPPAPAWPPTAQHLVLEVQKTPSKKLRRPTDGEAVAGTATPDAATVAGAAPRSSSGSGRVRTCAGVGAADGTAACAPAAGEPAAASISSPDSTAVYRPSPRMMVIAGPL